MALNFLLSLILTISSLKFHRPSTSESTGREKWKKNDIIEVQLSFFKMAEKSLSETSNVAPEDPNDIFGKFIACELKQLGLREQRIAKHEMEGILFRIQMQSERQKKYSTSSSKHSFSIDSICSIVPKSELYNATVLKPAVPTNHTKSTVRSSIATLFKI